MRFTFNNLLVGSAADRDGPAHGGRHFLVAFFLGAFMSVARVWLLNFLLGGESSSELVPRGGVLVRRLLARVGALAWISVGAAAGSSSSRSSRVVDLLLGGSSGGNLP